MKTRVSCTMCRQDVEFVIPTDNIHERLCPSCFANVYVRDYAGMIIRKSNARKIKKSDGTISYVSRHEQKIRTQDGKLMYRFECVEHNGRHYSNSYFKSHFKRCQVTDNYYENNLFVNYHGVNQSVYGVMNNHTVLHPYNYKPEPVFFCDADEESKKDSLAYYGIELEVVSNEINGNNVLASFLFTSDNKTREMFYFKTDCSIRSHGNAGVEIVSHPLSLKFVKKSKELKRLFKILNSDRLRGKSGTNYNSGMHVHINRKFVDKHDEYFVCKALNFAYKNRSHFLDFSERTVEKFNDWCRIQETYGNVFPNNDVPCRYRDSRYYFLNLENTKTYELRLFNGTTDIDKYMGNVLFVKALNKFLKKQTVKKVIAGDVTWGDFVSFVKKSNRYNQLSKTL